MTRTNKQTTPSAPPAYMTVFAILPGSPTFDAVAAVAVARVYGRKEFTGLQHDWQVNWCSEDKADAMELVRLAEASGYTVVDLREYSREPWEYSRLVKLGRAMDLAADSDHFLRIFRENGFVRQVLINLRANNGAVDEIAGTLRGGYLKKLPLSFVWLIRALWNCTDRQDVPNHEELMNRWLELIETCISPATRKGEQEKMDGMAEQILRRLGVNRTELHRHPFTLAGHIARLWEAGWSWNRIQRHTAFWREMFVIAKETEPSYRQAWSHIVARRTIRGMKVAVLEVRDSRVASKCWRVGPQGEQVQVDVLVVMDLRTGRPLIMANPGASIRTVVSAIKELEPDRWYYEDRYRQTNPTRSVQLMNGGVSRNLEPSNLTLDRILGILNVHLTEDPVSAEMAAEYRKQLRESRKDERKQQSGGGRSNGRSGYGRPGRSGSNSNRSSGRSGYGRPSRGGKQQRGRGSQPRQRKPQPPKKQVIKVIEPTGPSGVRWTFDRRGRHTGEEPTEFNNPFAGLRLVDVTEE